MKEKKTWRFWVSYENDWRSGKYYEFKSFKVYWAYRWYLAEQRDKKGTLNPTDKTCTKRLFGTDVSMYD